MYIERIPCWQHVGKWVAAELNITEFYVGKAPEFTHPIQIIESEGMRNCSWKKKYGAPVSLETAFAHEKCSLKTRKMIDPEEKQNLYLYFCFVLKKEAPTKKFDHHFNGFFFLLLPPLGRKLQAILLYILENIRPNATFCHGLFHVQIGPYDRNILFSTLRWAATAAELNHSLPSVPILCTK